MGEDSLLVAVSVAAGSLVSHYPVGVILEPCAFPFDLPETARDSQMLLADIICTHNEMAAITIWVPALVPTSRPWARSWWE